MLRRLLGTFDVNIPPVPVVARVGGLDPTFGDGQGVAKVTLTGQDAVTAGIAAQPDNKLVVAVTVTPAGGGNSDFELYRLNADGSIDTSFGVNGFARANFPISATADSVELLKDGRILVVGSDTNFDGTHDFAFARFTSTGQLDTTLNGTGIGIADLTPLRGSALPTDDIARAVFVNPNGSFYIAGSSDAEAGKLRDFVVAKFTVAGILDSSFNKGAVFLDLGGDDVANAITLSKTGQILLAGSTTSGGKTRFAVARLNANGKVDLHFGTGNGKKGSIGFEIVSIGNSDDEAFSVATLPNNDIIAGGFTATGTLAASNLSTKFALAGLLPTGLPDKTFGKGGKVITGFAGQQLASITSLSVTTTAGNTRILASGKAASSLGNALTDSRSVVEARYLTNGALDPFFGTRGESVFLQPDTLGMISRGDRRFDVAQRRVQRLHAGRRRRCCADRRRRDSHAGRG